ncbi:MAG: lipoprotein [Zoogloeaceae bacterium]|nr:lipoprotein [Rhodocyclaceae bacterium]MCP5238131.1 lipoprotein [Zoogloeaceae bacterium]
MLNRLLPACLLAAALVAGCGIKGPLYLPSPAAEQPSVQVDHSKAPAADSQ